MDEVYLHIGNGGITFKAGQGLSGYLTLEVKATHFGQTTNHMEICTDAESMRLIGEMLIEVSKESHPVYCLSAKAIDYEGDENSESNEEEYE